ncbi:flagellar biosynthesis protein FlhB [Plastorhodobacter daqingensis]|uniref:Flagellar biosynthesis protein FlhB n=1 Tax=Plastorhodobacter daqingensis TaxID=1387281 RepID=A0ABW2UGF6_9RHOB
MAEGQDDGQEKTEEPSARKLDKAREEGQILTSKEAMVFGTLAAGTLLLMMAPPLVPRITGHWAGYFRITSPETLEAVVLGHLVQALLAVIVAGLALGVPLMLVTLGIQAALGGINFAPGALGFKVKRINPLSGLKRMVSLKALVEMGKAVLKVLLLGASAAVTILLLLPQLDLLALQGLGAASGQMHAALLFVLAALLVGLAVIAVLDVMWQHHSLMKTLRMSRQEIKDENKQTEGSPEVKSRIRRLQYEASARAASQRGALDKVAQATAIITNPTHFAVALHYEPGSPGAPVVLAMGRGAIAEEILRRADAAGITRFQSPLLARALYFTGSIGAEIPDPLYSAVATVLAHVFRLEQGLAAGSAPPAPPEVDLPEDMRFDEFGKPLKGATA